MGLGGGVIRNVKKIKFMALVSLLALLGQLALSDSGSNHKGIKPEIFSNIGTTTSITRKLLLVYNDDQGTDRIGIGPVTCSKNDILITEGRVTTTGIPTFIVQITNVSVKRCSIYNVHLNCGWFSSVNLIDPKVFRRLEFNNCLVKDGEDIHPAETLSFHYSNSFPYPLNVSSVNCRC